MQDSTDYTLNHLNVNFDEAEKFLKSLAGDSPVTFQTFPERKDTEGPRPQILHGTFRKHGTRLQGLNREGHGVFVTVNETDLKGRREKNIVRIRGFFLDLDAGPLEPVTSCALEPTMLVETSPQRYQAYWLVNDAPPLEQFWTMQKAIARKFGGDESVCDLARCARLPGTWHLKAEPFMTRVIGGGL